MFAVAIAACNSDSSDEDTARGISGDDGMSMGGTNEPQDGTSIGDFSCSDGLSFVPTADWQTLTDAGTSSPSIVWTGEVYGALWLEQSDFDDGKMLKFGRFSDAGEPLGESIDVGYASSGSHRIIFNGERFVLAWLNRRSQSDPFDGVRVAVVSTDGDLSDEKQDIEGTFDTLALELAWDSYAGGLLAFTRGAQSSGGLFVVNFGENGLLSEPRQIESQTVVGFALTYGQSAWSVAYGVRDEEGMTKVWLNLLDDAGVPHDEEPIELGQDALGSIKIAFNRGNYVVAWSAVNLEQKLMPKFVLLDGDAAVIGQPIVDLPYDFATIEHLVAHPTQGFVFAWQSENDGVDLLGVQVMSALGILQEPLVLSQPQMVSRNQTRLAVGSEETLTVIVTKDSNPQPSGLSESVRLERLSLSQCE